ncbi:hypothetical protein [Halocola ammonii]
MTDFKKSSTIEMFLRGVLQMDERTVADQLKETYSFLAAYERGEGFCTKRMYQKRMKDVIRLLEQAFLALEKRSSVLKEMDLKLDLERVTCAEDLYKLCVKLTPFA